MSIVIYFQLGLERAARSLIAADEHFVLLCAASSARSPVCDLRPGAASVLREDGRSSDAVE